MAYLDRATGAEFIPELWAQPIYKFLFAKMGLRNSVDDYSSMVKGMGDTVHIPKILRDATATKANSTAVTFSTSTKVSLSIDKHKYLANIFEDIALIQSNSELISKYTRMYGESLARTVEDDVWAELDGFTTSRALTADNRIQAADLENILNDLYSNDIDPSDCSIAVNNEILSDIMNPADGIGQYFIRSDASGEGSGLRTGSLGTLYGLNVFYSRAIASSDSTGAKVGADMIYGVKLIDESGHVLGLQLTNP